MWQPVPGMIRPASMQWSHDDPITGERLQQLARTTILTPSILAYHSSLSALMRGTGHEVVIFRGSHSELEPDASAIERLRGRRSLFVYSHLLESFVERVLPRLDHRIVLISHNSDHGVDGRFHAALEDPRIVHWFAQNALTRHPKLTALPIGVANVQWPHGNLRALVEVANTTRPPGRNAVYVNFDVRTNPTVRGPLLQRLEGAPLAWRATSRPFADYLAEMASCRWVMSPPGNGVDCHRTWETLYLGRTPIVQRTDAGAGLHDGLPIIQLPDLSALEPGDLESAEQAATRNSSLERTRMSYWRERVGAAVAAALG